MDEQKRNEEVILARNNIAPMLEQMVADKSYTLKELASGENYVNLLDEETKKSFIESVQMLNVQSVDWEAIPFPYAVAFKFFHSARFVFDIFNDIRSNMNKIIDANSAETMVKEILSDERIQTVWQDMKNSPYNFTMSVAQLKEQFENDLKNPNSDLTKKVLANIEENNVQLQQYILLRGNLNRGVYEYCQEQDYEYALTSGRDTAIPIPAESNAFDDFAKSFSNLEKSAETDRLIEAICQLMPRIYICSEEFFNLHTDPNRAREIYEETLRNRKPTKPSVPLYSKDVLPREGRETPQTNPSSGKNHAPVKTPNNAPKPQAAPKSSKSAIVTAILCIFLGYFGVHNFYLGKKGKGILYLLTLGLCGFGVLADIYSLLNGKTIDGDGKTVKF